MNENQVAVLRHLNNRRGQAVAPDEIGWEVGEEGQHSAWVIPICKRLVAKGYAEMSENGWYSITDVGSQALVSKEEGK